MNDSSLPPEHKSGPARRSSPAGPGAIIALLTVGGAIGGGLLGQPAVGMVVGLLAGFGIGLAMWLVGRK